MEYDDGVELRHYVVRHLMDLMTEPERERIWAEMKLFKDSWRSSFREQNLARQAGLREQAWQPPARTPGYSEFLEAMDSRVLRENASTLVINRCPMCNSILRTPQAKLCLWCGHSQYGAAS